MQQVHSRLFRHSELYSRPIYDFQEETEYRSDGTKKVLRPARLSLARVSVLRGDGPMEGVPFVDDHIHTSEEIVDYLTEFSGVNCMVKNKAIIIWRLTWLPQMAI